MKLHRQNDSKPVSSEGDRPLIMLGVTAELSLGLLTRMADQLSRTQRVGLVSSPGSAHRDLSFSHPGLAAFAVPMQREIAPLHDLFSLVRLVILFKRTDPSLINFGTPKAGLVGMVAGLLARVPSRIYTLRGLRMETATGSKRLILWMAERVACASAHRVVCISPSIRERAIQLGLVPAEKASVLGNGSRGVDMERFNLRLRKTEQVAQLRQALGLLGNERVIGFVGRFVKDKGIRELVETFRELSASRPDLRLLLVGDFESGDPVEPDVRQYIESTPAILRPGFVADTAPYYALMDVFVLPTYREGFPGVPLEAQASEVPVVTTNATGAVDSVQHGITGLLVPVKDVKALTEAIDTLLRNPTMRADMGHAGRKWMEQAFRPETIWQAHADLYREMLEAHSQRKQRRRASLITQRAFDLLFATAALIALSPLLALVALVVRIFLGSPLLFRQVRPGYKARPFTCLKFRTMTDRRDAQGQLLSDAERLTPLGRSLRSTSLDELPELINVIRGEMSLVGPRPLLMRYLPYFTDKERVRFEAMPGITGLAQVRGRNDLTWDDRLAMDVDYVATRSLFLDLKILAVTLRQVVWHEGVQVDPGSAMLDLDAERTECCQQIL
jgi:lipopolysaccharide/colanic/teichoic acid biosynthesis glycosyltransferase